SDPAMLVRRRSSRSDSPASSVTRSRMCRLFLPGDWTHDAPMHDRYAKSFRTPDDSRDFGFAQEAVVELGDITAARRVHQPGWRWSEQMRRVVGGEWCQARHVGVVLGGRFGYTFEDGTTLELETDDVFDIPPGHDGYTLGDDDCVVIEWVGVRATTGFGVSA